MKKLVFLFAFFSFSTPVLALPILLPFAASVATDALIQGFQAQGKAAAFADGQVKKLRVLGTKKRFNLNFSPSLGLALASFAIQSGYGSTSLYTANCGLNSSGSSLLSFMKSERESTSSRIGIALNWGNVQTVNGKTHYAYNFTGYAHNAIVCSGGVKKPSDVLYDDMASSISQADTSAMIQNLKDLAVIDKTSYDQIIDFSAYALPQAESTYLGLTGFVSVDSAGSMYYNGVIQNGASWIDSAGVSHTSSVDAVGNLLVDGQSQAGFTASNPTNPVNGTAPDTLSPTPPTGTNNATGSDLGAVVAAINASKEKSAQDMSSLISSMTQTSTSSTAIQTAVETLNTTVAAKQTDCEKFPDSAGCAVLGTEVSTAKMSNDVIDLGASFTPVDLGQTSAFACPSPFTGSIQGQTYEFSYQPICDVMQGVRPVVLAIAWFVATMVFVGGVRQS